MVINDTIFILVWSNPLSAAFYLYTAQKKPFKIHHIKRCNHKANSSVLCSYLMARSAMSLWMEDVEIVIIVWWMLWEGEMGRRLVLRWRCLSVSWGSTTLAVSKVTLAISATQMSSYKTDGAERSSETRRKRAFSLPCFHVALLQKMMKWAFICTFSLFICILVVNLCKCIFISVLSFLCFSLNLFQLLRNAFVHFFKVKFNYLYFILF